MTPARDPKQLFWEAFGRASEELSGIWRALWEAFWSLGEPREPKIALAQTWAKHRCFFCRKWRERPFRVDGSDPTLTVYCPGPSKLLDSNF